jgi:hypothetical protein
VSLNIISGQNYSIYQKGINKSLIQALKKVLFHVRWIFLDFERFSRWCIPGYE